jgi:aminopeptidase N
VVTLIVSDGAQADNRREMRGTPELTQPDCAVVPGRQVSAMRLCPLVPIALGLAALLPALAPCHLVAQRPTGRTGDSRPGVDVLQYAFRVEFPATRTPDTIRIVSTITARRTTDVRALRLDLVAAMQVDSVRLGGRAVPFTRTGDAIDVPLTGVADDSIALAVYTHGHPTDGLIIRQSASGTWTAFGDNFPNRARQWLAVIDHPSDKALVEWDVRAPATHRVIANGALVEESPEPGPDAVPMVRTRWRTARPIYTAVMVIGVAPFAVVELGATACGLAELPGCVAQSVWTSPAQRAVVPGNFARAGEMVALFSRLAGPFPYEKLAHVSSSTRYGGMENAAAIFYAEQLFREGSPTESLIAHETAHQWFGDAVTEREWPHVWLSEGFATYFAALWSEHAHGDSALRRDLTAMRATVLKAKITWEVPVINESLDDVSRVLNSNVYQKAGFVLHMLRREIGDSAFFGGIRAYYAAHRHGNAMTADLQRAFETASGRPLDWFFEQWLLRPGVAVLRPSWRYDTARRALLVTVTQGARAAPYRLTMAMDVTDAAGATTRMPLPIPAQASVTLTIPMPAAPSRVVFDADVGVLAELTMP